MDKKRHGLQTSGRMKLRHHHSERKQQTMSKKIVQLTKVKFNPGQSKSRRNNPGRKDDLIASSAPMKAVWIDKINRILSFRTMEHA